MDPNSADGHRTARDDEVIPVDGRLDRDATMFAYRLDKSDPDVLVLRRKDGTFVAAFSAQGATREGILKAAREDHARLVAMTSERTVIRVENEDPE